MMALANNEKNNKLIVGHRLETLRLKYKPGYRKCDVADELGFAHSTYNDKEAGRRGVNRSELLLFAEYYNTSVDYLTGKTDDDSPPNQLEMTSLPEKTTLTLKGKPITKEQQLELEKFIEDMINKAENRKQVIQ